MWHQFSLIQDRTTPTKFAVELDGKPIEARSVNIHVGVDCAPTVMIELMSTSVIKMNAKVTIKGDNA